MLTTPSFSETHKCLKFLVSYPIFKPPFSTHTPHNRKTLSGIMRVSRQKFSKFVLRPIGHRLLEFGNLFFFLFFARKKAFHCGSGKEGWWIIEDALSWRPASVYLTSSFFPNYSPVKFFYLFNNILLFTDTNGIFFFLFPEKKSQNKTNTISYVSIKKTLSIFRKEWELDWKMEKWAW